MVIFKDKQRLIEALQEAAQPILELFRSGEPLTGEEENALIGTIHTLQEEYNNWLLCRQPVKEQSFPPQEDGG